jgi:hypothetical protein
VLARNGLALIIWWEVDEGWLDRLVGRWEWNGMKLDDERGKDLSEDEEPLGRG